MLNAWSQIGLLGSHEKMNFSSLKTLSLKNTNNFNSIFDTFLGGDLSNHVNIGLIFAIFPPFSGGGGLSNIWPPLILLYLICRLSII